MSKFLTGTQPQCDAYKAAIDTAAGLPARGVTYGGPDRVNPSQPERWRAVRGHSGYEVSDMGRVRSFLRRSPRLLKPEIDRDGYLRVGLRGKHRLVHRLVLEAFVGPCPIGMQARHYPDRTPANCRLDNLSWASGADNNADKRTHGTWQVGSRNGGGGKLSDGNAIVVSMLLGDGGLRQTEIARAFGVSKSLINQIALGRVWGWLR